jgi:hypothetical protein
LPKDDTLELIQERARLEADNAVPLARIREINALLIQRASAKGDAIRETVAGIGTVSVSPPKPKRCEGTAPIVVVAAYLALPKRSQDKLVERGIIKIEEQWIGEYHGRVTVKLFPRAS